MYHTYHKMTREVKNLKKEKKGVIPNSGFFLVATSLQVPSRNGTATLVIYTT